MREKLIADWLAKANERSFQIPFCSWLIAQGFRVLHLTRHGEMELGKDVIAVAPDGVPCAYQLKGTESRITISMWRDEIHGQLRDAADLKLVHPSLPTDAPYHRTYLVTNGNIDEPVARAIDDYNRAREAEGAGHRIFRTITGPEMLAGFVKMGEDFWPTDLVDTRTYLELYLAEGVGRLAKEKLASLLETTLDLDGRKPGQRAAAQSFAAAALICAAATAPFTQARNWVAEFEAWAIYLATVLACAEQHSVLESTWRPWADFAAGLMYGRLDELVEELRARGTVIDGHPVIEKVLLPIKTTEVAGLVALHALWTRGTRRAQSPERASFVREWLLRSKDEVVFYGEHAAPLFFAVASWYRFADATPRPDFYLLKAIDVILGCNGDHEGRGLPNPYRDADAVLMAESGHTPIDEGFKGLSFSLEIFVHLFARRWWKLPLVMRWSDITRVSRREFVPASRAGWLRWRTRETGDDVIREWRRPETWANLLAEAYDERVDRLPPSLLSDPFWYLAFVVVYPHRFTADGAKWAESRLWELCR